ncbi:hypothetical protein CsatA_019775 [Cannabis sativa]
MGRAPCCSKVGLHRGPWTPREDTLLTSYIQAHGEGHWRSLPKKAGLLRCGKSCRLRWMNYLRPDIKRGNITPDEDDLIIRLHSLLGNRWSLIAGRLPGRTDNEIKNYWNTHLSKRIVGSDPEKLSGTRGRSTKKRGNINNNNNKTSANGKKKKIINKKNNKKKNKTNNDELEMPKIHLPKPVRVSSFSLVRNYSFEGSTTTSNNINNNIMNNNNNNVTITRCESSSSQEIKGLDHHEVDDDNNHDVNDDEHVPWLSFMADDNDDDLDNDHDLVINGSNNSTTTAASDNNHSNNNDKDHHHNNNSYTLEKLYEEYRQLLKTEEFHDQQNHDHQAELDSFAESLLI